MSIASDDVIFGIDMLESELILDEIDTRAQFTAERAISTLRQVTELGVLTLQVFGVAVDQVFRASIDIVLVTIQTVLRSRAALALSNPLLAAGTIALGSLEITALAALIISIKTQQTETSGQLQAGVSALRLMGGTLR